MLEAENAQESRNVKHKSVKSSIHPQEPSRILKNPQESDEIIEIYDKNHHNPQKT